MATMKRRVIYLSDEEWERLKRRAAALDMTISAYLRSKAVVVNTESGVRYDVRPIRAKRKMRSGILKAFDVTEAELMGVDSNGYGAAREQAERERAAYVQHLEAEVARLERQLTANLTGPSFNTRPFTPVPKIRK